MRTKESLLQCHPALIPQNLGPLPSWLPVNTSLSAVIGVDWKSSLFCTAEGLWAGKWALLTGSNQS